MLKIDFESEGKHTGCLRIHHSTDESAYGSIEIPIVSLKRGTGPTILCVGGNHGDEFEGQLIWARLARELQPEDISGQLIILPALNTPAAIAGRRVSPLDELNLNRVFPGKANGSPTERIAHVVETDLLPRCGLVIDLHSGGRSLHYLPGPSVGESDPEALAILRAFGGPVGYVFDESSGGAGGMLGACRRAGIRRLGSEIGGLGSVSPGAVKLGYAGTIRVLVHLGVLPPHALEQVPQPQETRLLRRGGTQSDHFIYAPSSGLFEPFLEIGDDVETGQVIGELSMPELPWVEPIPVLAKISGTLICRRGPGRTQRGDGLIVLGTSVNEA